MINSSRTSIPKSISVTTWLVLVKRQYMMMLYSKPVLASHTQSWCLDSNVIQEREEIHAAWDGNGIKPAYDTAALHTPFALTANRVQPQKIVNEKVRLLVVPLCVIRERLPDFTAWFGGIWALNLQTTDANAAPAPGTFNLRLFFSFYLWPSSSI